MRGCVVVAGALAAMAVSVGAQGRSSGTPPEIVEAARLDPSREINFASGVWPARLYVGQQATYQIGIFLSEAMRSRLRSNPQFVPPDVRSMIAYDLPVPARLFQRREADRTWDVHVFSRALFPLSPGTQVVPPARLTYSVPLSNSIFSREESHSARSAPQTLTVLEPPVADRPAGYLGAVGRLAVRARVDTPYTRVGDPVLLTLTVSGIGNVGLFPRPALVLPWGHVVAGTERVRVDSSATLIAGDKEFEWVLTPRVAGAQSIPGIRYPYFNPYTERYEVAITPPLGIVVRTGTLAAPDAGGSGGGESRLGLRRVDRGDVALPWPAHPLFWVGVAFAPIPAAVARWRRRRVHETPRPTPRHALDALARAGSVDVRHVRRVVHDALSARIPTLRAPGGDVSRVERILRRAGVSVATARDARRLLSMLDEASWAGRPPAVDADLAARATSLLDRIDEEAVPVDRPSTPAHHWPAIGLLIVGAGVGVALSAQGAGARDAFQVAVSAYDEGDVSLARQGFHALALQRPRAPDVWANLGTASWELGDTAGAAIGWQRALRLQPLAEDVRKRLGGTPSFRGGLDGDVPPVPVNATAALGALCWVAGWLLLARSRRTRAWSFAHGLITSGILLGLATVWAADVQRGRRQVVVVSPDVLRDAPAMSARRGASLDPGETGRVVATQGAWTRVRFGDDRIGWLDARRVESLEVPSTP
ncbi:MAG: BatD family protein [Gemmatimonadaceae bacterium]|nr:BatD family protein [Gemmatimonadaceae bacterium]